MSLSAKGFTVADTDLWRHTFKFTAVAGQVTLSNRKFTQPVLINGGKYIIGSSADSQLRDYIEISFVDVDGLYYPAGTVLKTFLTEEYVASGESEFLENGTVAELPAGIYVRATYVSSGASNVDWRLRLFMRR